MSDILVDFNVLRRFDNPGEVSSTKSVMHAVLPLYHGISFVGPNSTAKNLHNEIMQILYTSTCIDNHSTSIKLYHERLCRWLLPVLVTTERLAAYWMITTHVLVVVRAVLYQGMVTENSNYFPSKRCWVK